MAPTVAVHCLSSVANAGGALITAKTAHDFALAQKALGHTTTWTNIINAGFGLALAVGVVNSVYGGVCLNNAFNRIGVLSKLADDKDMVVKDLDKVVPTLQSKLESLQDLHSKLITRFANLELFRSDDNADVYVQQSMVNSIVHHSDDFMTQAREFKDTVDGWVNKIKNLKDDYDKNQAESRNAAMKSGASAGVSAVVCVAAFVVSPTGSALSAGLHIGAVVANGIAVSLHSAVVILEIHNYSKCCKALRELAAWEDKFSVLRGDLEKMVGDAVHFREESIKMEDEIKDALQAQRAEEHRLKEEERKRRAALEDQVSSQQAKMQEQQAKMQEQQAQMQELKAQMVAMKASITDLGAAPALPAA